MFCSRDAVAHACCDSERVRVGRGHSMWGAVSSWQLALILVCLWLGVESASGASAGVSAPLD
eukprot:1554671-Rhodomonas_salina.1